MCCERLQEGIQRASFQLEPGHPDRPLLAAWVVQSISNCHGQTKGHTASIAKIPLPPESQAIMDQLNNMSLEVIDKLVEHGALEDLLRKDAA